MNRWAVFKTRIWQQTRLACKTWRDNSITVYLHYLPISYFASILQFNVWIWTTNDQHCTAPITKSFSPKIPCPNHWLSTMNISNKIQKKRKNRQKINERISAIAETILTPWGKKTNTHNVWILGWKTHSNKTTREKKQQNEKQTLNPMNQNVNHANNYQCRKKNWETGKNNIDTRDSISEAKMCISQRTRSPKIAGWYFATCRYKQAMKKTSLSLQKMNGRICCCCVKQIYWREFHVNTKCNKVQRSYFVITSPNWQPCKLVPDDFAPDKKFC